jgi:hypothetical protein
VGRNGRHRRHCVTETEGERGEGVELRLLTLKTMVGSRMPEDGRSRRYRRVCCRGRRRRREIVDYPGRHGSVRWYQRNEEFEAHPPVSSEQRGEVRGGGATVRKRWWRSMLTEKKRGGKKHRRKREEEGRLGFACASDAE